jgi:hypothetical protein
MGTMRALRAHVRGGPGQLVYEQAPAPAAGPGEALVAVHAAAITFAELTWDLSWTTRAGADRTPVIPSHELSGVIAGLGHGVTNLAAGDAVIGLIDFDRGLAARGRPAGDPQRATGPRPRRAAQDLRHYLHRGPGPRRAEQAGRAGRRGPAAHGAQPDLPAGRGTPRLRKRRASPAADQGLTRACHGREARPGFVMLMLYPLERPPEGSPCQHRSEP